MNKLITNISIYFPTLLQQHSPLWVNLLNAYQVEKHLPSSSQASNPSPWPHIMLLPCQTSHHRWMPLSASGQPQAPLQSFPQLLQQNRWCTRHYLSEKLILESDFTSLQWICRGTNKSNASLTQMMNMHTYFWTSSLCLALQQHRASCLPSGSSGTL